MPQIHLSVPVMEDGILDNLSNIERDILNDGIVEQGTLGGHLTHVRRRNETRRDEMMPDLGDKGQMFGLEVDGMALTVEFPLTLAISQNPNDFGVVGALVKTIKRLRGDMIQIIIVIDRLRIEVDQHTPHSNFLDDVGGEIGVEFSHHTHRRWIRWFAKCPPSLGRNRLMEKIIRVVETLFLNERTVLTNGAKPIGGTVVNEPGDIVIWGRILTGPTSICRQFLPLSRHWKNDPTPTQYDKHLKCLGKTKTNRVHYDPKCDPTNLE